jgi:hypothetical protein
MGRAVLEHGWLMRLGIRNPNETAAQEKTEMSAKVVLHLTEISVRSQVGWAI